MLGLATGKSLFCTVENFGKSTLPFILFGYRKALIGERPPAGAQIAVVPCNNENIMSTFNGNKSVWVDAPDGPCKNGGISQTM